MATLGQAYVQIIPSAQGISGKISNAIAPEANNAGKVAGDKIRQGMGNRLSSIGSGLMKAGAIATAVSVPIIAGLQKAMSAYQVQNAAETKLTEIYRTRMGATKQAAAETMKLASALQREGVVGDEVALSGAQQLATFAKYPSTVNSLLPAMENLLVQQKGLNGTAQDATQIGNLMGKVLNGQTGALTRVGVSFTAAQEKVLKYGTESQKAAMLAKVITQNVGNMNKAMLATPEGKIQQMKNSLGDLAEQLGAAVAPAIATIAQYVSQNIIPKVESFLNFMKANPIIGKIVVGATALLAVGGPLMAMIGGVISKFSALGGVITRLRSPITLVIAAIGVLAGAFISAYKHNSSFKKAVDGLIKTLGSAFKPVLAAISQMMKAIGPVISSLAKTIATAVMPIIKAIIPVIQTITRIIAKIAETVIPILTSAIETIAPIVQKVVKIVGPIVQKIFEIFSTVFTKVLKFVGPIFEKILSAIKVPIEAASKVVGKVVDAISAFLKFTGLGKLVEKTFGFIKDYIIDPITKAKEKVGKIIDTIKGWFPFNLGKLFTFEIPNIYGKKDKVGYKFTTQWQKYGKENPGPGKHAKGGIFPRATLLASASGAQHIVGEKGPEAILPLNTLWNQMDKMAVKQNQPINATYYITVDGAKDPAEFARELVQNLKVEMRS